MSLSPLPRQVRIHKALAHPARLRVLAMLRGGELCVCQITAMLRLAVSTVSAHLSELKTAELVEERKTGRWVYYHATPMGSAAIEAMWAELASDPQVTEDAALLQVLRKVPVEAVVNPNFKLSSSLLESIAACSPPVQSKERT